MFGRGGYVDEAAVRRERYRADDAEERLRRAERYVSAERHEKEEAQRLADQQRQSIHELEGLNYTLECELEDAKATLRFYSDESNYLVDDGFSRPIDRDQGKRARSALGEGQ